MVFTVCSVKRKYNVTISTGKEYLVFVDDDDDDVFDAVGNGDAVHGEVADIIVVNLKQIKQYRHKSYIAKN